MVWVFEQVPIDARVVVPLAPLADFLAHENQLFTGARPHVRKQRALIRELAQAIAGHLREHRAFAVHDFVMRERQHKIFAPRVEQAEGQIAMVVAAVDGIEREVLERVMHPAHVPLEAEAEPAHEDRAADPRPRRGFLGDHHDAGVEAVDVLVELLEK